MRKNIFIRLIFFILFIQVSLFAQFPDTTGGPDTFGHRWITSHATGSTIDYDWIDALSGDHIISTGDNGISGPEDIGFTFNYYGIDYTQFYASFDGFISFSSLSQSYGGTDVGIPTAADPDTIIAIAWDQYFLNDNNNSSGVYYRTVGTEPYRKLVIQWHDLHLTSGFTDDGSYNFQIVLYETINKIEFNYGVLIDNDRNLDSLGTATIGIENGTGGSLDGLEFADNDDPAVTNNMSILFYGDSLYEASAYILPDTVLRNTSSQQFSYNVTGISSRVDSLGKADHLVIDNPFTSETMTVLSIEVDGNNYFVQNS